MRNFHGIINCIAATYDLCFYFALLWVFINDVHNKIKFKAFNPPSGIYLKCLTDPTNSNFLKFRHHL